MQQRDLRRAKRERKAIIIRIRIQIGIAQIPQSVAKILHTIEHERAHGGDVEAVRQRASYRNRAEEGIVVIARHIQAGRGIELNRRILQY